MTEHKVYCAYCRDSGFIVVIQKSNKSVSSFRCNKCKKAEFKNLSGSIPLWDDKLRDQFTMRADPVEVRVASHVDKTSEKDGE